MSANLPLGDPSTTTRPSRGPRQRGLAGSPLGRLDRFDLVMIATITALGLLIAVVVLRGVQVGPGVRSAAGGPRILFLGPVGSVVQNLYTVAASGGTPQQLTQSKFGVMDYDVLPDGRVVYADQKLDGSTNLMLLDTTTGKNSVLYECADATCIEVAWQPGGGAVAFDRSELNTGTNLPPGAPRVWLYDLGINRARRLFDDNQKLGYMARWSHDGKRIAIWDSDRGGIVIYNFETREEAIVPAFGGQVGDFSPDGKRIWFPRVVQVPSAPDPKDPNAGNQGTQFATHIAVADLTQTPFRVRDLIPDTAADDDTDPIWAPDGKTLYVLRRPAGATLNQDKQIFQLDVATGTSKPILVDYAFAHSNLSLSPDGQTLLMQRFRLGANGARPEIWTLDLRTNTLRQISDNGNVPRWLP